MANISKITLPNGTSYDLKDAWARGQINKIISGGIRFIGISSTEITDGGRQKPTINGEVVTPVNGDLVFYGSTEFLFTGEYVSASSGGTWQLLGSGELIKAMAYADTASGSYTPAGSVSQPTFSGSSLTSTGSYTPAGNVTISASDENITDTNATFKPKGTVSQPSFTGTQGSISVSTSGTALTAVSLSANSTSSSGTDITPSGSINASFLGTQGDLEATSSAKFVTSVSGSVNTTSTGGIDIKPGGTVSTPTITVTPATTTKYVASSTTGGGSKTDGVAASWSATVSNQNLTFAWTTNTPTAVTLPTFSSQTIATGISSATSTQPTFTGTQKYLHITPTTDDVVSTGKFTPEGSVSGSFSGSAKYLHVTPTKGTVTSTGNFTPSGSVSQPEFTGINVQLTGGFAGTAATVSVTGTPAGTVSKPNFTGTAATITVTPDPTT